MFHAPRRETRLGVLRQMAARADLAEWLTKDQVAEALGCSTKQVERYAGDKRLQKARYRRQGGGPRIVVYHPQDVARLRLELNPAAPPFVLPAAAQELEAGSQALAPAPPAGVQELLFQVLEGMLGAIARVSQTSETRGGLSETSQTEPKLWLTVDEAVAVSGLPRATMRREVQAGRLMAIRTGRGWRISLAALRAWEPPRG